MAKTRRESIELKVLRAPDGYSGTQYCDKNSALIQYKSWNNQNEQVDKNARKHDPSFSDDVYIEALLSLVYPQRLSEYEKDPKGTKGVISHLKKLFKLDNDKQAELLARAKDKESYFSTVLNLEVVEAKSLKSRNNNGFCNPFCRIIHSSHFNQITSTMCNTLNPVWEEQFSFLVSNIEEEILHVDVVHFSSCEDTVKGKIKNLKDAKQLRKDLKNLVKDIAVVASTGKVRNMDTIGCLKLPLKDIPPEGIDSWFQLNSSKGNENKNKGAIHLKLGIGRKQEKDVSTQVYQHVLHLMVSSELVLAYNWDGVLENKLSKLLLQILELKDGFTKKDIDLSQWLVYTKVHCEECPLNTKIFPTLLQTIFQYVKSKSLEENELRKFWRSTEKLVENFFNACSDICEDKYGLTGNMSSAMSQGRYMQKYKSLSMTMDLLKTYSSAMVKANIGREIQPLLNVDLIMQKSRNAAVRRANEFFDGIAPQNLNSEKSRVGHLVKVAQLLVADLGKSLDLQTQNNSTSLDGEYFQVTYLVYDKRYFELAKPIVVQTCANIKPLNLINDEHDYECCQDEYISIGTALFKLYLELKQFAGLSTKVTCSNALCIKEVYPTWFQNTIITQWLDISRFKVMNCIRAAVYRDDFQPLDSSTKITSSAIDTAAILQSIEIWNQLPWQNLEDCSSLVAKVIEDVGRCVIYYADLMSGRIDEREKEIAEEKYPISSQLCFSINNIQRVHQELKPISEKIGMSSIIQKLASTTKNGNSFSKPYDISLITATLENARKHVNHKIKVIFEKAGLKMYLFIQKLLTEAAELQSAQEEAMTSLINYLNLSLIKLNELLSNFNAFEMMFTTLWRNVLLTLQLLITTNAEKRRPPSYFKEVGKIYERLKSLFYPEGTTMSNKYVEIQETIENLLEINGSSISGLVLKYCRERQKIQAQSEMGFLTVRAYFCRDVRTLKIEILNARHLKPRNCNGQRDPYVKVYLVTKDLTSITSRVHKSKTHRNTLFPWFDEQFSVPIKVATLDELKTPCVLMFTLKDYGRLGTSEFIGDCFLPLDSIPITTSATKFEDLPQVILPLTLPKEEINSLVFQTIENRQHLDRPVVEFVRRERKKLKD